MGTSGTERPVRWPAVWLAAIALVRAGGTAHDPTPITPSPWNRTVDPNLYLTDATGGSGMNNGLNRLALAAAVGLAAVGIIDVGAVRAADMAVKAPPLAARALYNWSGCYVGGYVGWAAANQWTATDLNGFAPSAVSPWDFSLGSDATGGGTLGCNWQAYNWLVLGIEGEGGFLKVEGSAPQPLIIVPTGGGFGTVRDTAKVGTGYGLIAGRVGAAFDRLLVYSKLGVAFYNTTATITDANNLGFVATGSKSQTPFAVGGGVEYAMWDHWTGKAEYLFFDRGTSFNACGVSATQSFCWKQDPSPVHTFKIGLNYKFW
jgi:outer membrane immunogenic protein